MTLKKKKVTLSAQERAENLVGNALHHFNVAIDGIKDAQDILAGEIERNNARIASLQASNAAAVKAQKSNASILAKLENFVKP